MPWSTEYDRFLSGSAWMGALIYSVPAIVLIVALQYFDLTREYVVPALIIYLIGALAHMVTYAAQAICIQIKACTDYALEDNSRITRAMESDS